MKEFNTSTFASGVGVINVLITKEEMETFDPPPDSFD